MRPLPILAALFAVATLAGCGTKTPLKLPPPAPPAASGVAAPPAADKAAEPGR